VLAPGAGLGEAFLIWSGQEYIARASDGGHADFAPAKRIQAELWACLR
jgi:glucokinase